jgi:hypothetical protein
MESVFYSVFHISFLELQNILWPLEDNYISKNSYYTAPLMLSHVTVSPRHGFLLSEDCDVLASILFREKATSQYGAAILQMQVNPRLLRTYLISCYDNSNLQCN